MCKVLVKCGVPVDHTDGHYDLTPLHLAAIGGHYEVCEFLIESKASVFAEARCGETPLLYAANSGHENRYAIVKLLLERALSEGGRDGDHAMLSQCQYFP